MRHNLWLLSAFTVAATLTAGSTDAEAKKLPKSSVSTFKPVVSNAYSINTGHCHFPGLVPKKEGGWKASRLTAQFIKSDSGAYRLEVLPGATNIDEKLPMASITKLMTALVAFEQMDQKRMNPHQMIPVTRESLCLNDNRFAVVGLPAGIKEIPLADALTQMLKLSSNTMSVNVASATAGSVDHFVELMNAKARAWGMDNTRFVNPHGLPEGDRRSQYTTARDMLIMAQHILPQFERFRTYSQAPLGTWILPEKPGVHPEKKILAGMDTVFKTGTISECASLLTMAKSDDNKIVDIQLCGKNRFQNALASVKDAFKRFAEMMVPPATAASSPAFDNGSFAGVMPAVVSSRQVHPSAP